MGLCDADTPDANLIYSLWRGNRYWGRWFSAATTDADRAKWRLEIKAEATENTLEGGRLGGTASAEEEGIRAVIMGLCDADTSGANLIYSLGRGNRYWGRWFSDTTTDADRAK